MTRKITTFGALLALTVVAAAAVNGCGDSGEGSQPKASRQASATASPAATVSSDPLSGDSTGLESNVQTYDAQLGGIYQAVAVEAFETGAVRLSWVTGDAAAAPVVRIDTKPGVVDVWLSDLRPHADLMTPLRVDGGPVKSVAFVAPADDSLIILRLTLRDSGASARASVETTEEGPQAGSVIVSLHD